MDIASGAAVGGAADILNEDELSVFPKEMALLAAVQRANGSLPQLPCLATLSVRWHLVIGAGVAYL